MTVNVSMTLSMEGYIDAYVSLLSSPSAVNLSDIHLVVPVGALHGLTRMGMLNEALPVSNDTSIHWKWSAPRHMSSSVWVGSVDAGVRLFCLFVCLLACFTRDVPSNGDWLFSFLSFLKRDRKCALDAIVCPFHTHIVLAS